MKYAAYASRFICGCLLTVGSLQAQSWKPWPGQPIWSGSSKNFERNLTRVVWLDNRLGTVKVSPCPGLLSDSPVISLKVAKEQARVESLGEQEGPLKHILGGLPWPPGSTMIGDPNQPELERAETNEWILYRLTWATTRQGYTPNGILILAWHKPSRHWKAWGCECDAIELTSQLPSKLTFKATGSVNTGDGYQDWSELVHLDARPDRVILAPGRLHLLAKKP